MQTNMPNAKFLEVTFLNACQEQNDEWRNRKRWLKDNFALRSTLTGDSSILAILTGYPTPHHTAKPKRLNLSWPETHIWSDSKKEVLATLNEHFFVDSEQLEI